MSHGADEVCFRGIQREGHGDKGVQTGCERHPYGAAAVKQPWEKPAGNNGHNPVDGGTAIRIKSFCY